MKIKKKLNNNAVLATDGNNEIVLTGKGIGYDATPGLFVDETLIEKRFVLSDNFKNHLDYIFLGDKSYYEISEKIFNLAKAELTVDLSEQSILELADHIAFLIDRIKQGKYNKFVVMGEVAHIYPTEYKIGKAAVELINETYKVEVPTDEAGFIAFHIVSLESEIGNEDPLKQMRFVSSLMEIIERHYINFKDYQSSISYTRMIIHLRFLGNRVIYKVPLNDDEILTLMNVYKKNKQLVGCIEEINEYVLKTYGVSLTESEKAFIMMHINRLDKDIKTYKS